MNSRAVALVAGLPFLVGIAVGAAAAPVRIAAAQPAPSAEMPMDGMPMEDMSTMHAQDPEAMDAMHADMADQMPAELREACDEMHTAMSGAAMPMRADRSMPAGMPAAHAAHHR